MTETAVQSVSDSTEESELVEEAAIVESDLLVEDVSIDGMCGVY